jgi:hypothetical protein
MVDAIIREWLRQVLGVEAARSRYGDEAFRVLIAIFYADNRIVFARSLFKPIGLRTNTTNTKGMTCVSTRIQTKWSHEVYINVRHGFHTPDQWQNCWSRGIILYFDTFYSG